VRTRDYNITVPSGQDALVFVMPFNSSVGTFPCDAESERTGISCFSKERERRGRDLVESRCLIIAAAFPPPKGQLMLQPCYTNPRISYCPTI
jgi:hypothetical protein